MRIKYRMLQSYNRFLAVTILFIGVIVPGFVDINSYPAPGGAKVLAGKYYFTFNHSR